MKHSIIYRGGDGSLLVMLRSNFYLCDTGFLIGHAGRLYQRLYQGDYTRLCQGLNLALLYVKHTLNLLSYFPHLIMTIILSKEDEKPGPDGVLKEEASFKDWEETYN